MLFFSPGSFFREKTAVLWVIVTFGISSYMIYTFDVDVIVEKMRAPSEVMYVALFLSIAILFYSVSRRLPKADPRRRTVLYVSIAWVITAFWNGYIGVFWGEYPIVEAAVLIIGAIGFIVLLYGMTTGKATRA